MTWVPYTIYRSILPTLKIGHAMRIGEAYLKVAHVRGGRYTFSLAANQPDPGTPLWIDTLAAMEVLHGQLDQGYVVHWQYFGLLGAGSIRFKWMTDPLMSKRQPSDLTNALAGITNVFELNKWSYDKEMHMKYITAVGVTNTIYAEVVEYIVQAWSGRAPDAYLELFADGTAAFVRVIE